MSRPLSRAGALAGCQRVLEGLFQADGGPRLPADARAGGEAATGAAGSAARGGNVDALTRNHGMTFDEAANILNVKRGAIQAGEESELQRMLKVSRTAMGLTRGLGGSVLAGKRCTAYTAPDSLLQDLQGRATR